MEGRCQFCRRDIGAGHSRDCPYYEDARAYRMRLADLIWPILVEHAGADPSDKARWQFARALTEPDLREYRFCGSLGFGGKFSFARRPWCVTCYQEDETPARLRAIAATNEALAELREALGTAEGRRARMVGLDREA